MHAQPKGLRAAEEEEITVPVFRQEGSGLHLERRHRKKLSTMKEELTLRKNHVVEDLTWRKTHGREASWWSKEFYL